MKPKLQILAFISFVLVFPFTASTQVDTYPLKRSKQRIKPVPDERIFSEAESNLEMDRAAGDLIVSDDFSDPANWTFIDLAGEGANWEIVTEEPEDLLPYFGEMASTTEVNGFGAFNGIPFLIEGDCPVQDAVLELNTIINCSEIDHVTLSFEQHYRAYNTDDIFLEVSDNGGVSYDYSYQINADWPTNGPSLQTTEILNITEAAAGKEFVKIRFRWIEETGDDAFGSGYGWFVDDLKIYHSWDYDQRITTAYHRMGVEGYMPNGMEYYKVPYDQLVDVHFSAKIQNMGGQPQENVKLNVVLSDAEAYSGVSDAFDLPIDLSDSITLSETYTSSTVGNYELTYWFDSDSTEQVTNNDTLYSSFEVTTSGGWDNKTYSRANDIGTGSISNVEGNTGLPFLIGNVTEFFVDDYFCTVNVNISNEATNVGQLIFAQIMKLDEETGEFIYVNQSEDHEIVAGELGGWVSMYLPEDCFIEVMPGDVLLVLVGHYGGTNEVEFREAQKTQEQTVLGYISGSTEPFSLEDPNAIMINLIMSTNCCYGIDEKEPEKLKINQNYPNPSTGQTTIEYTLVSRTDLKVEITDLSGRIVQTIQLENMEPGDHQLKLETKDFAPGVYQYTFKTSTEMITKQMIVE